MSSTKLLSLEDIAQRVALARSRGQVVVQCHGVFDLLHVGHLKHLEAARAKGDLLVVTITPDELVNKGPNRPLFAQHLRAEMLAALECVDFVGINRWPTAVETIRVVKPTIYCKGVEYRDAPDLTGMIGFEEQAVQSAGGRLEYTDEIVFSSSNLINQSFSPFPPATQAYLQDFRNRYRSSELIGLLEKASELRVLVVGDTIIDQYQYCTAIGKSSKEPTLVLKNLTCDRFAGGILAVANHIASLGAEVKMVTLLGAQSSHEEFIRSRLHPGVDPTFLIRPDAPTIVKHRFVEQYFFLKLLELYDIDDSELSEDLKLQLCRLLEAEAPRYDLVVVVDYGHGFLHQRAIETLCEKSRFLAVNTQANAGNLGFHTISKYRRADYITATENELRLELRSRHDPLEQVVKSVCDRHEYPRLMVTRGKNGCLGYDRSGGFCDVPAVAGKIVDRVGAGDAFLSISALCAVQQAPLDVVGFMGNVAGAHAVATVCNESSLDRVGLFKHLEVLLK